jgi:hypothetical protein
VRTLLSAAAVTVEVLAAAEVTADEAAAEGASAVAVVADAQAAEVLDAAFFLGRGEEATRARRDRERMVDEKRIFAVCFDWKNWKVDRSIDNGKYNSAAAKECGLGSRMKI